MMVPDDDYDDDYEEEALEEEEDGRITDTGSIQKSTTTPMMASNGTGLQHSNVTIGEQNAHGTIFQIHNNKQALQRGQEDWKRRMNEVTGLDSSSTTSSSVSSSWNGSQSVASVPASVGRICRGGEEGVGVASFLQLPVSGGVVVGGGSHTGYQGYQGVPPAPTGYSRGDPTPQSQATAAVPPTAAAVRAVVEPSNVLVGEPNDGNQGYLSAPPAPTGHSDGYTTPQPQAPVAYPPPVAETAGVLDPGSLVRGVPHSGNQGYPSVPPAPTGYSHGYPTPQPQGPAANRPPAAAGIGAVMDPTTSTLLQQIFHLQGSVWDQKDLELQRLRIQVEDQTVRIQEQGRHIQAQGLELTRLQQALMQQTLTHQEKMHKQKLIIVQLKAEAKNAKTVTVANCAVGTEWKDPAAQAHTEPWSHHSRSILQHQCPAPKEQEVPDTSASRLAIMNDAAALVPISPAPSAPFSSGGSAMSMALSSRMGTTATTIAKGSPKQVFGAATTCPINVQQNPPCPLPTVSVSSSSSSTSSALSSSHMGSSISTKHSKTPTRTHPYANAISPAMEGSIFLAPVASSSLSPSCGMTSSSDSTEPAKPMTVPTTMTTGEESGDDLKDFDLVWNSDVSTKNSTIKPSALPFGQDPPVEYDDENQKRVVNFKKTAHSSEEPAVIQDDEVVVEQASVCDTPSIASTTYGEGCHAVVQRELRDPHGDAGRYSGVLLRNENLPHGEGRMVYDDGRVYKGNWYVLPAPFFLFFRWAVLQHT
jgi:hypothetical protein